MHNRVSTLSIVYVEMPSQGWNYYRTLVLIHGIGTQTFFEPTGCNEPLADAEEWLTRNGYLDFSS